MLNYFLKGTSHQQIVMSLASCWSFRNCFSHHGPGSQEGAGIKEVTEQERPLARGQYDKLRRAGAQPLVRGARKKFTDKQARGETEIYWRSKEEKMNELNC